MRLHLKRLKTKETLDLSDECTLHDLRLQINDSAPSSVHFSLNRRDELVAPSPQSTLRSLGVTSGDLIYYSLYPSEFTLLDQKLRSASSAESQKTRSPVAESNDEESDTNQAIVSDSMTVPRIDAGVDLNVQNQANADTIHGEEEPVLKLSGGMGLAGITRLSELLLLKKIFLDECSDDTSESRIVVMTVHAVMLDSGFLLFDPDSSMPLSFFDELHSISLKYTLPALISASEPPICVTLKFQRLGHVVVVYGSLGVGSSVRKVCFDKRKYVPIVVEDLKSDKEDTLSNHSEVYTCWRMIKDGIVTPLLIDLCFKTGLVLPPCFMCLPTELKLKILRLLPGVDIARLACVSSELRDMGSDDDLWKQKYEEEDQDLVVLGFDTPAATWKGEYATFWRRTSYMRRRIRDVQRAYPRPYHILNR